jgi:hypothetical protein
VGGGAKATAASGNLLTCAASRQRMGSNAARGNVTLELGAPGETVHKDALLLSSASEIELSDLPLS